jgi:hypothetical protein
MRELMAILLVVGALGACNSSTEQDKDVADASLAQAGGADGSAGPADAVDPCAPYRTSSAPVPLVAGSDPACPRCGPYSERGWNPSCSREGLVCEYLAPAGTPLRLGAYCRCGRTDGAADAGDSREPLRFGCAL